MEELVEIREGVSVNPWLARKVYAALLEVLRLSDELTVAVDAAADDIEGFRRPSEVLKELGPAVYEANYFVHEVAGL